DRRAQIRYAQRTYRQKKELMYRDMERRLGELEKNMNCLSTSLADFRDMAVESDLHVTHPRLFEHLTATLAHAGPVTGRREDAASEVVCPVFPSDTGPGDTSSFGYIVNPFDDDSGDILVDKQLPNHPTHRQHKIPPESNQVERPLPGSTNQSYSFQEPDPTRMLHRYCLEYVYRLFSDPRSNPQEFYRVFRLVPCVKYKEKMGLYLLCLVRSGSSEPLDIPALPFYCIGGAGTHYPQLTDGKPKYPENMRLPRRVLGTVVGLCSDEISSMDRQKLLKLAGLDGVWLDCGDVTGYLQQKGVLDGSVSHNALQVTTLPTEQASWTLDKDGFFQAILANMVILGRSPGFRLSDVEAAFNANLRADAK
ncbi:hypothetical protein BDW62DRAFT_193349, partial [Aspergillus aurantiobrunneus]